MKHLSIFTSHNCIINSFVLEIIKEKLILDSQLNFILIRY